MRLLDWSSNPTESPKHYCGIVESHPTPPSNYLNRQEESFGGTVDSETTLRSPGILLSQVRAPLLEPWPDGGMNLEITFVWISYTHTHTHTHQIKQKNPKTIWGNVLLKDRSGMEQPMAG
ncbi:hypothetical protein PoB_002655800 [Plakobranchus ocellatus]|uniref:Uncharacterized protein n=1 Tax=Plakobranchus ocellatus TaxID=259542 RepID=A0AAV3ZYU4_9GAST|nr:hypothetical protein PoB_002655800 [Plakobranchus ocellatus]